NGYPPPNRGLTSMISGVPSALSRKSTSIGPTGLRRSPSAAMEAVKTPGGDSGCDIGVPTPHAVLAPSQNTEQTPLPIEWVHSIDTVFGPRQEFLHDHGVEAVRARSSVAALRGFRGFGYGVAEIRCGGEAETCRTAAET